MAWIRSASAFLFSSASPLALFSASEPGVWYDPSDVANLAWRRNLLTFTEQFDKAVWAVTNATVTTNTTTAPDGTLTAEALIATAISNQHYVASSSALNSIIPDNVNFAFSCYFKPNGKNTAAFSMRLKNSSFATVQYDLLTQTLTSSGNIISTNITAAENGFYRIAMVANSSSGAGNMFPAIGDTFSTYTGDGISGIYIWGAQIELGSVATDYQRISDVNTEVRERFPTATLFQDIAGTLPVTTPGQSVGLVLDKSRGLALGPNLVTNSSFSDGTTGWTATNGSSLSSVSGNLRISYSAGAAYPNAAQNVSGLVVGRTYEITIVANTGSGTHPVGLNCSQFNPAVNITVATSTTTSTYRTLVVATGTTSYVQIFPNTASTTSSGFITVISFSVREIAGNHATQATFLPIYGVHPAIGLRNVAQGSADVGNITYWPTTVLSNGVTATKIASGFDTDGLPYVDVRYQGTSTATFHASVYQTAQSRSTAAVGQTFTASVFFQRIAGTATNLGGITVIIAEETAPSTYINQTPSSGALSTTETLVSVSRTLVSGNQVRTFFVLDFTSGVAIDVTYRIKGLQLERGSSRTAYQFNYNRFNVTQPPFAQSHYLFFDGVDDFLVTPTITPGTDKVQIFAGVRKLTDLFNSVIVEHSSSINSNNGTFLIAQISGSTSSWQFLSKGTNIAGVGGGASLSPELNVLTGLGNISGDTTTLRRNSSLVQTTSADQGPGNYLAYPIYVGRRGSGGLQFNGNLYSLIVRFGANLTTNQITDTELYVNKKTGAY